MTVIREVDAWEVLDSRGNPTVRTMIRTDSGKGIFTVPSGASTGAHEALELRDGGSRMGGKGVRRAVENILKELAPVVQGMDASDQRGIDLALVEKDGTDNLSNLGANAVLGVSGASAHAAANSLGIPLYVHLSDGKPGRIPMPLFQMLNAGVHAQGGIEVQDFSIIPTRAHSLMEAYEIAWAVFNEIRGMVIESGNQPVVGDEGGLSPPLGSIAEAFELVEGGIERAGHSHSRGDVALALDVASTHFWDPASGDYLLESEEKRFSREEWVDQISEWVEDHHIVSVEDPLGEDDWDGWRELTLRIGGRCQVLGDDLLVTNLERLKRAIEEGTANAILIKPNQVGTITGAVAATRKAKEAGFGTVISARSGETCDTTISDLAVGLDAGQLKLGSHIGSGRTSKYNRLLEITKEYGAKYAGFAALSFNGD
ncbi:MAG: phosphopyruvate hydratase [Methanomassiliicoccales archaeon]|nr:phosphopyruvate hydratase [Methanomassiliicoccales archaeon]NYT16116.1 phosphopyruvate hydratase [Methanomassiliicoccales archaeon]